MYIIKNAQSAPGSICKQTLTPHKKEKQKARGFGMGLRPHEALIFC
jgi:hypothetical protein